MGATRSNRITDIGELQLQVFDVLCRLGEGTVYDVLDQFPEARRPRYTTVLTVLRSLEQKGLATHSTRDRTYVFRPTVEPTQLRGKVLRDVLERAFGGSPTRLMATLLSEGSVTPEVVEELRALLESEASGDEQ